MIFFLKHSDLFDRFEILCSVKQKTRGLCRGAVNFIRINGIHGENISTAFIQMNNQTKKPRSMSRQIDDLNTRNDFKIIFDKVVLPNSHI